MACTAHHRCAHAQFNARTASCTLLLGDGGSDGMAPSVECTPIAQLGVTTFSKAAAQCASACPGVAEGFGACTGRGACDDGVEGGGTCDCADGFEGARCGGAVSGEMVERSAPALSSARNTPADFALAPGQRWGGAVAVLGGRSSSAARLGLAVAGRVARGRRRSSSYCGRARGSAARAPRPSGRRVGVWGDFGDNAALWRARPYTVGDINFHNPVVVEYDKAARAICPPIRARLSRKLRDDGCRRAGDGW